MAADQGTDPIDPDAQPKIGLGTDELGVEHILLVEEKEQTNNMIISCKSRDI